MYEFLLMYLWAARTPVSSLHFKLKSCTPWSILLKMTFPGDFSSDIESISTILSAAWYTIDSSTPIYYFLADFLGMMRVLNSDGFDSEPLWIVGTRCKCRSAGVDFFPRPIIFSSSWSKHMTKRTVCNQSLRFTK